VKKRCYASLLLQSCYALSDSDLKKQLARGLFYHHQSIMRILTTAIT
jgi:hypothetical protein